MEQIKIFSQQLVAEVLSQMRSMEANSLPVYDKGHFIGKISYKELIAFLDHKDKTGSIYTHKLNFEIGTALFAIRRMEKSLDKTTRQSSFHRQLFVGLSSAAAIAFLLSMVWLFFKHDSVAVETKTNLTHLPADQITLSTAKGTHIALNADKSGLVIHGEKLNYSDGSEIAGQATLRSQSMILNVPRKGMYRIVLQDGSKVWLNSASSLKFPATFEGATARRVELTGEAYFEISKVMLKSEGVKHNTSRMPFIVVTDKQEIEVLGTHFNVSAYQNEGSVQTTLVEGSVRLRPAIQSDKLLKVMDPASVDPLLIEGGKKVYGNAVVLKPNDQATLAGNHIAVKTVDAEEAFAWTNGEYVFRNMALESIMRTLTRWYNVDVVYKDKKLGETLLGGSISKSSNINDVLKMLELSANVHFKIEGRRITVVE